MSENNSDYSRREFLSRSSIGLASAGFVGVSGNLMLGKNSKLSSKNAQKEVIFRTLGKTGIKVPIVSMGVMNANNPEIVKQSYEAGVRLFDTAEGYQGGRNEEMVGSVIKQLGVRDKVIITTKIAEPRSRGRRGGGTQMSKEQVRDAYLSSFDGCLRRLQMDYVDVLMIHNVTSAETINNPGVMEAFEILKNQKKTRFAGISAHPPTDFVLNEIVRTGFYDVVIIQFNFTMADDKALLNAIKNAAEKGVGLIAMKAFAGGPRRYRGEMNYTAMLKWVLQHEQITTAIPGYVNFDEMKESFSVVSNLEYTPEEKKFIGDENIKSGMEFCRQCSECVVTCPKNVDIPTLMRTHMYAARYSNFYQARTTLDEIPPEFSLKACASCVSCTARCSNSVNIAQNIDELKLMYV